VVPGGESTGGRVAPESGGDELQPDPNKPYQLIGQILIPRSFFNLSGRTRIWEDGLDAIGDSLLLGHGFQADRLLLGTHIHNAFLQSLIQTGILGATAFMAAVVLGWILTIRNLRNLNKLAPSTRHTMILTTGLLVFLSIRSIPESTGAFFGVDLLILAPVLLYIETVARSISSRSENPVPRRS
jgi:O-antigen ligase